MAIPVIKSQAKNDGEYSTTLTCSKPTGVAVGDLLVLICGSDEYTTTPAFSDNKTGWIFAGSSGGGSVDVYIGVFYRIADGTEGTSESVTQPNSRSWVMFYTCISGVDATDIINVSNFSQATNVGLINPITTTMDNCLVLYGVSADGGDCYPFSVSGTDYVQDDQAQSGPYGNGNSGCWGHRNFETAGYTGWVSYSGSSDDGTAYFQIAINESIVWDGIVNTPEISVVASAVSDIQIQIATPEIVVTAGVSVSGIYIGTPIPTHEISATVSADSDIQIQIDTPEITVAIAELSDVFAGHRVDTPEITVSASADSDIQLGIVAPGVTVTTSAAGDLQLQLLTPEITVTAGVSQDPVVFFTTEHADIYYLFTLTGAPDVEIPISSFQCRMRSGDPTYLSLVIPGMDYTDQITARANGTLQIEMAYKQDGEYLQREVIVQADLETVSIDEGADNQSITLTGHKTETFTAKSVTLENSMYRSVKSGKVRHRIAKPNIYLKPGDTVTVGSDTYTADLISYAISVDSQTMEIAEA